MKSGINMVKCVILCNFPIPAELDYKVVSLLFLMLSPKTDSLTILKILIAIICISTKLLQSKGLGLF